MGITFFKTLLCRFIDYMLISRAVTSRTLLERHTTKMIIKYKKL